MQAQQIATTKLSDEEFLALLERHPDLRDRFASIVSAVENSEGNLKEADAVEERIIEEMRLLEREAMRGWAERQVEVTEREIRQQTQMTSRRSPRFRAGPSPCVVRETPAFRPRSARRRAARCLSR
jgi:hypothetical protein